MQGGHAKKLVGVGGGLPGERCRGEGKGRSGTGVFAWCLSEFVGIEYRQPNTLGPVEVIRLNPRDSVY